MVKKSDKEKLKTLERQYKEKNKYIGENYDRIGIVAPKGTKERIKDITGMSVNKYINMLIDKDLKRRTEATTPQEDAAPPKDDNFLPFR